jgi:predicted methyltransferase
MDQVTTKDGFITFFCKEVGETYHPCSSIREEVEEKYVRSLDIQPGKIIFDICFGLGYLTAGALDALKRTTIYCFENDEAILRKILEIKAPFASYMLIQEFVRGFFAGNDTYEKNGVKLIMIFGDAREKIKDMKVKADYVFFAPFSPGRAPDMWTTKFLSDIRMKMNPSAKLATFSYARMVQENLKAAGFTIRDGPILGRRSPSLIAENP